MKEILLIGGKARSGKDYVSEQIKNTLERNGKSVLKFAFADELKKYICILFDIDLKTLDELKNSEEPFTKSGTTIRQCLQRLGTDIFFLHDKYYWTKIAANIINSTHYDCYIISDFRYPHESEISSYVDNSKVYTANILGGNALIKSNNHTSEISLDNFNFDFLIDNSTHNFNIDNLIDTLLNN